MGRPLSAEPSPPSYTDDALLVCVLLFKKNYILEPECHFKDITHFFFFSFFMTVPRKSQCRGMSVQTYSLEFLTFSMKECVSV